MDKEKKPNKATCGQGCVENEEHQHEEEVEMKPWQLILSAVMLVSGMVVPLLFGTWPGGEWVRLVWFVVAFLPVGLPVMGEAWEAIAQERDFFSEFMLMSVACIGAFALREYPEAVAVMLLYCVGEMFQDRAIERARDNIKSLMAFRPDHAVVVENGKKQVKSPESVKVGDIIEVRPGDRVPLDGILVTEDAAFNTAALTGESMPRTIAKGKEVLAGMIATESVSQLSVERPVGESAVSRILGMVEEAAERKAPTELFIHRFAHIYTPIVIVLAVLTIVLPYVYSMIDTSFVYQLEAWVHRALVFLVISCPCALVVSIPLSYFAGIGAASKRGILFKGGNYLDAVTELQAVVFDKTGTLTTGEFNVTEVVGLSEEDLQQVSSIEQSSTHPIAKAINRYCPPTATIDAKNLAGYGLSAGEWLVGTLRLLDKSGITYPEKLKEIPDTIVACAHKGRFVGYVLLADTLKQDAEQTVESLRSCGVERIEILSGDKQALVDKVARHLRVDKGYGDLLPQGKVEHIDQLRKAGEKVAFVGDGINDAPVLALSDVGMAMGAMGADMAIETADVIIQTDQPSKVAEAISIGRRTRAIVHQNIVLAIGIKLLVMVLGVFGVANLWEAVFADSGVALLAVLNATRVFMTIHQPKKAKRTAK